jgi:hypothetical protein
MYREEPDNEQDSGWRFFSGVEPQGFVDNPDNIAIYSLETIAEIDPDILPFLSTEPPCAFERETSAEPFHASQGYSFEPEE